MTKWCNKGSFGNLRWVDSDMLVRRPEIEVTGLAAIQTAQRISHGRLPEGRETPIPGFLNRVAELITLDRNYARVASPLARTRAYTCAF
jgi:hypothetical protein